MARATLKDVAQEAGVSSATVHVHYVDLGVYGGFCFCKAQVSKG